MLFPESVSKAVRLLEEAGFEAYPVGGCVRDTFLHLPCSDFDITTSALPEETRAVFSDYKVIETGIRHGTVTVMMDLPLEITTFRVDLGYTDGRHPDAVAFTRSLREDLARRDFTINAMASRDGKIIDPFGGLADIAGKRIRAVGDPYVRFREDALRILRGLRFAATLKFEIERETAAAMEAEKENLKNVSVERITEEIRRLSVGAHASRLVRNHLSVLRAVIPGLNPDLKKLASLPPASPLRLAALLGDVRALDSLRLSNREADAVRFLLTAEVPTDPKRSLRRYGAWYTMLLYLYHELEFTMPDVIWKVKQLAVSGDDLLALGLSGVQIGETLEALLDAVMAGEVRNEREELLAKVRETC